MITNCPDENLDCSGAENLCEEYCTVSRLNPFAREYIDYIPESEGACFVPQSYGDDYGFVSNNEISCPLIHYY